MKHRVVFFSADNLSLLWWYERISLLVAEREKWKEYNNLNDVIELFHVFKVLETGIYPTDTIEEQLQNFKDVTKMIKPILGKRFSIITDENFESELTSVDEEYWRYKYQESFWEILMTFGGDKRISKSAIDTLLSKEIINIYHLLVLEKAVKVYGAEIRKYLITHVECTEILIHEYLEQKDKNDPRYFFPDELTPDDKIDMLNRYIDSEKPHPDNLKSVWYSKTHDKNFPIDAKIRLKAKRRYEAIMSEIPMKVIFSVDIQINSKTQSEPVKDSHTSSKKGFNRCISYDTDWILNNLDYPTLLNNFIHVFADYVDLQHRWQCTSKKNMLGVFERAVGIRAKKQYVTGVAHRISEMVSHGTLTVYYETLQKNNIKLESIVKWFFEEYLVKEFNVKGFLFNEPSDGANILEKCRNMAIEIESILKQFKLYCENGEIDRELFEISEEHMLIENIPSLIKDKYIYPCWDTVEEIFWSLFSSSSCLFCSGHELDEGITPYKKLLHSRISYEKLDQYNRERTDYLIENSILSLDDDKKITYSESLLWLLSDLYENGFQCRPHLLNSTKGKEYKKDLDFLLEKGMICYDSSFLSKTEQDYYNYIFNARSCNELDLRNKYAHGTNVADENQMHKDYFIMLRMMILIIIKINDEFCLWENIKS